MLFWSSRAWTGLASVVLGRQPDPQRSLLHACGERFLMDLRSGDTDNKVRLVGLGQISESACETAGRVGLPRQVRCVEAPCLKLSGRSSCNDIDEGAQVVAAFGPAAAKVIDVERLDHRGT